MGPSGVHDGVCAEQNIGENGEVFRADVLREEAVGGGVFPERSAQFGRGVAPGLCGFGKLRLKSLGLGGHLEHRPCPFRDAD